MIFGVEQDRDWISFERIVQHRGWLEVAAELVALQDHNVGVLDAELVVGDSDCYVSTEATILDASVSMTGSRALPISIVHTGIEVPF